VFYVRWPRQLAKREERTLKKDFNTYPVSNPNKPKKVLRVEDFRHSELKKKVSKTRRERNLLIERIHRRVSMMESLTRNENCKKNLSAISGSHRPSVL